MLPCARTYVYGRVTRRRSEVSRYSRGKIECKRWNNSENYSPYFCYISIARNESRWEGTTRIMLKKKKKKRGQERERKKATKRIKEQEHPPLPLHNHSSRFPRSFSSNKLRTISFEGNWPFSPFFARLWQYRFPGMYVTLHDYVDWLHRRMLMRIFCPLPATNRRLYPDDRTTYTVYFGNGRPVGA